jgi:hypothetical protein
MCPACLAAAALIAGAAVSTSGVAALAVKKFWTKNLANGNDAQNKGKENQNGQ